MTGETGKPPQGPQSLEYKIGQGQWEALELYFQGIANTKGRGPYGYHEKAEQGRLANALMNYATTLDFADLQNRGAIVVCSAAAMGAAASKDERDSYELCLRQYGGLSENELTIFAKYCESILEPRTTIEFSDLASYVSSQTMLAGDQAFDLERSGQPVNGLRLAVCAMAATVTPSSDNQAMMMDQMKKLVILE